MDWAAGSGHLGSVERWGAALPNPNSIVGSFELSSMVKNWGSGDAIDEPEGIRSVWMWDISVELRIFGELFRCRLGSLEICST